MVWFGDLFYILVIVISSWAGFFGFGLILSVEKKLYVMDLSMIQKS